MSSPNQVNYGAYVASTAKGEICSVNIRPPLPSPHQRRVAKLALQNYEPALGTPQPALKGEESHGVIWRTVAAITETRFIQTNLYPDQLLRARDVAVEALQAEGLSVVPIGGIIITENGLLG